MMEGEFRSRAGMSGQMTRLRLGYLKRITSQPRWGDSEVEVSSFGVRVLIDFLDRFIIQMS